LAQSFSNFITEEVKEQPYKLIIFNNASEQIRDVKDTGFSELAKLMAKSAKAVDIDVRLVDFLGCYVTEKGGKTYINSFPLGEDGVTLPDIKGKEIEYQDPIEINPETTIIMPRGLGTLGMTSSRYWVDMIRKFELQGYVVVPNLHCWDMCSSKYMTDILMNMHGLKTPKTVAITHSEDTERAVKELGNKFPMIMKSSIGTQTGVGVVIVESLRSLNAMVQMMLLWEQHLPIILQEYVKIDYDIRVVVLDGNILGAMKRNVIVDESDFRSNVSLGGEAEPIELTEIEIRDSLTAADAVQGRLVGVDLIPAKDREKEQPLVLEVNSMPGFGGIEKITKDKSITQEIFRHFKNRDNWKGKYDDVN
jgi:ribosomal protein S6--L-glutamate ligase